jgi:hypothetical protein
MVSYLNFGIVRRYFDFDLLPFSKHESGFDIWVEVKYRVSVDGLWKLIYLAAAETFLPQPRLGDAFTTTSGPSTDKCTQIPGHYRIGTASNPSNSHRKGGTEICRWSARRQSSQSWRLCHDTA